MSRCVSSHNPGVLGADVLGVFDVLGAFSDSTRTPSSQYSSASSSVGNTSVLTCCTPDDEITRLRSPAVLSDSSNPGPLRQFIHPSDAPVPSETSILAAIAASMPARISSNPSSEDSRCDSFRLRITEVSIPAALEKSYTTKRGTTLTVPLKAARSFCLTECAAAKNKKPLRGKMTAAAPVQL